MDFDEKGKQLIKVEGATYALVCQDLCKKLLKLLCNSCQKVFIYFKARLIFIFYVNTRCIPCRNCSNILHPSHDLAPESVDLMVSVRRQHQLHALYTRPLSWHRVLVLLTLS